MRFINTLIYSNQTGIRILRHLLFWLVDMSNWLMVKSISSDVALTDVFFFLVMAPPAIITTYFILYYLIPKFSGRENGKLLVSIIAALVIMGCVFRIYRFAFANPLLGIEPIPASELLSIGEIIGEVFKWLAVISMAIAIKLIKNKTELQQKNQRLLHEKRIAELSFLKLQMHPHFLFNTLNTLYAETIQTSGRAGQIVIHLSNLLRFILEECNKPEITLDKEITVIRDYIALEKLRHGERLNIKLSVPETSSEMLISPLLFLPFVENSFKHSLNNVRGPISIEIKISLNEDKLTLIVENDHIINTSSNGLPSGRGIANVRRQLELLYNGEHSLDIIDSGDKYRIELIVPQQTNPVHV